MLSLNKRLQQLQKHHKKQRFYNKEYAQVTIPTRSSFQLGEFVGAFAGDGNYYFDRKRGSHRIRIFLHRYDDRKYAFYLGSLIYDLFNKNVSYFNEKRALLTISFHGRKIYDLLNNVLTLDGNKSLNVSLQGNLYHYPKDFLRGYVRGLFDTDGFVEGSGSMGIGLISKNAIQQICMILTSEKIKFSVRERSPNEKLKQKHTLYLTRLARESNKKFLKVIGFSNTRKKLSALSKMKY